MKHLFVIFYFLLSTACLQAQATSVTGQVVDADEFPLIGSYVILLRDEKPTSYQTTTDYDGNFDLKNVVPGTYNLKITYLGYADLALELTVTDAPLKLGTLALAQGVELAQVEVVEKVIPVQQRGDTTQLNAAAYKTLPDASAEELLQKMPTIIISDGAVQAQGERVKRVIVDGKPFFGDDALATLRNLPAEIIASIEIFDDQSEESRASGFDDGDDAKTINIVTKKSKRNGTFGKVSAGYGSNDRYDAVGNVNNFQGNRRLAVVGMVNNVNRQNFSAQDIGGDDAGGAARRNTGGSKDFLVKAQNGIVTTKAFGVNLNDEWGDNLKASASYFFNQADGVTDRRLSRQFFDAEGLNEKYLENGSETSRNTNHRFNGRFSLRLNDKNSLLWRPNMAWESNEGDESTLGTTLLPGVPNDTLHNDFNARFQELSIRNSLVFRHRFNKPRRSLSINLTQNTDPSDGDNQLQFSETAGNGEERTVDQRSTLERRRSGTSVNLQYSEPLSKRAAVLVISKTSVRQESNEQFAFDRDAASLLYDDPVDDLSGLFTNDYLSQEVGGGLNYRTKGLKITARANVQYAQLVNEQEIPPLPDNGRTFWSVLPTLSLRYDKGKSGNLRLVYRATTRLPAASQLQEVVNNANPRLLRTGNPNLGQEIRHNLYLRYNATKASAGTVFYALLGGGLTQDDISNSVSASTTDLGRAYELPVGTRITLPVNLDNSWNVRVLTTFGFPVAFIGSNLNLDLSASTTNRPGLINGELNTTRNSNTGAGLTFSSNISDRIDFSLSSRGQVNWVNNELQPASKNQFYQQTSRFNLNWILGPGIVYRTNLAHRLYRGLDAGLDQDYVLWNMSLGKKLLKNNRGEVSLSVFDLLGQNTSLRRRVTESFTDDIQTNVLTRYLMLGFRYDLRKFG